MRIIFILFASIASAQVGSVTVDGVVYPARPITGAATTTVTGPLIIGGLGAAPDAAWAGKVVLLDRGGDITYFAKVMAVQNSGGLAVVIINIGPPLINPTLGTGNGSLIPALEISQTDGAILKTKVGASATVKPPTPPTPAPTPVMAPNPAGHAGEFLYSDGTKLVYSKNSKPNPSISLSMEVAVGKAVTFTVNSWGPTPQTFQWIKDGVNIAGATAPALTITAVKATDAGSYVCAVGNEFGVTTSRPSTLVVK